MSDQGFFGDVFDSPDDDPLLQSDDSSDFDPESDESAPSGTGPPEPEPAGSPSASGGDQLASEDHPPSWMNDDSFMSGGEGDADDVDDQVPAEQQQVVVAPRPGDEMRGVETLNEAFDHGWRLRKVGLADSAEPHDPTFVVTIERDIPRSLFDFGPAGE
jgi:hypothetical protein